VFENPLVEIWRMHVFNFVTLPVWGCSQRNPFMMPCFAVRPPIFNKRLKPRSWLPVTGTVKLTELLAHCSLAFAYTTRMVPKDVPRLWWSSDEQQRLEVYAVLLQLGAVANDQELVRDARIYKYILPSYVLPGLVSSGLI
jgi:hypothetical protein